VHDTLKQETPPLIRRVQFIQHTTTTNLLPPGMRATMFLVKVGESFFFFGHSMLDWAMMPLRLPRVSWLAVDKKRELLELATRHMWSAPQRC
jgi:hypothetical protein